MPAILGGVLGLSMIINIILIIVVVILVAKNRLTSHSLSVPPNSAMNEGGGGNQGALDIEMKPNSLYGLTSDGIMTKPNEVYGVSLPAHAEPSQPAT
jgi:Na+-transporting NADH:ubiquinone oxidoreductase subunit NqrF